MKLFTRISFILFFVIVVYFTLDVNFYKNNDLVGNIIIYIFGLIISIIAYIILIIIFFTTMVFRKEPKNWFEIISEDIKLIYKQTKLITKFYLNL